MKYALITGGCSGIGKAIVDKFYQEEYFTIFCDITEPQFKINSQRQRFIKCDISNIVEVQNLANEIDNIVLDTLINNAGVNLQASIKDISIADWDKVIKTNLYGTFYITKYCYKNIIKNNNGSIINIGSDQSIIAKPNKLAYATSKGAINQFTKSLALDLASDGIRVNCVCPGPIATPMLYKLTNNQTPNLNQPIPRLGTPQEVAELVYFLSSDKATYITGATYLIDGGFTTQ
jgi:NAD(P)-dependent dehydrogenase (short-subunit alcohol dehydrogenase family)